MNSLTARQAAACENATTPVCRCRCGGVLHGAARREGAFELLPADDPHHVKVKPRAEESRFEQLEMVDSLERIMTATRERDR